MFKASEFIHYIEDATNKQTRNGRLHYRPIS